MDSREDHLHNAFDIKDAELLAYHGDEKHVVIPEGVRIVGKGAFRDNAGVRSVELGGVTYVGPEAFRNCGSLEAVGMHGCLNTIDDRAFEGCRALQSVGYARDELSGDGLWPQILEIGDEAFAGCTSLRKVDLYCVAGWLTIGNRAFAGCSALTTVALSDALGILGDDVFAGCAALECASLPHTLRSSSAEEARTYEDALLAIRAGCPNLQVLERRSLESAFVSDEEDQGP